MKSSFKNQQISKKLFSIFTNIAIHSTSQCIDLFWQQPKIPKCILEKEIKESKIQN